LRHAEGAVARGRGGAPQVPFFRRGRAGHRQGGARSGALMARNPITFGEVEGFINMLLAACEDQKMNDTLEMLLTQPDAQRKPLVYRLRDRLKEKKAPHALSE